MKKMVAARLRERKDRDIIKAIENIEPGDVSELIRKGLRQVLNIVKRPETKPESETEQTLNNVKQVLEKQKTVTNVTAWRFPK